MGALLTADGLLALATLSAMEIVLGIDNVVFIAILVGSPADVVASLKEWEAAGVQRVLLQMLDMEDLAAIELFARHVLPQIG